MCFHFESLAPHLPPLPTFCVTTQLVMPTGPPPPHGKWVEVPNVFPVDLFLRLPNHPGIGLHVNMEGGVHLDSSAQELGLHLQSLGQ